MTQTILITGASTGIGRATALHFHELGWNVIATMRSPDKETELNNLDNVLVTALDVTDEASIQSAVKAGLDQFGQIDVLLNNAGYGAFGPVETFPLENVKRQFDTNVIGLIETTKAVLPSMRERKSGMIINVSSVGGRVTLPLMGSLYQGTKWAVEGFSESLAYELEPLGITVKIIEPGAIATDFANRSFEFKFDPEVKEYLPQIEALQKAMESGIGDPSEPIEVAKIIEQAINDGAGKLRYPAAGNAEDILAMRDGVTDEEYMLRMKDRYKVD